MKLIKSEAEPGFKIDKSPVAITNGMQVQAKLMLSSAAKILWSNTCVSAAIFGWLIYPKKHFIDAPSAVVKSAFRTTHKSTCNFGLLFYCRKQSADSISNCPC
jgi:hypothetical protein